MIIASYAYSTLAIKPNKLFLFCLQLSMVGLLLSVPQTVYAFTVESSPLKALTHYPKYYFTASIVPHTESDISSELNARLLKLPVRPGQKINKGDVIAKLDCRDTEDKLKLNQHRQQEAKSKLKLAKLQLKRFKNLESRQHVATIQVDELLSQVQGIEANIEGLRVKGMMAARAIQRCVIMSPYDAVVTRIFAGKGQWMSVGLPIVNVVRVDMAEIKVSVPVMLAEALRGKPAVWQAQNQHSVQVEWLRQSGVLKSNQRMAQLWFKAPAAQLIGLHGELMLEDDRLHVPPQYVVTRNGQQGVFVLENDQAKFHILPHAQIGRPALVPSYWKAEMPVIIKGQHRLQDGMQLKRKYPVDQEQGIDL